MLLIKFTDNNMNTKWKDLDQDQKNEVRHDYFNLSQKDFFWRYDRQQSTFFRYFWPKKTYKFSVNPESIKDWSEMPVQDFCRKHHITNKTASKLLGNYPSNTNSQRHINQRAMDQFWYDSIRKMVNELGVKVTIEKTGISRSYIYANFKRC